SELLTSSAHTTFDPTASICEITNFLLVSATVTTSTIEALPIITPSDVSIARNLFARKASIDTDSVSFKSIMKFYLSGSIPHGPDRPALPSRPSLILFHSPQLFAHALVLRIQLQRRPVFLRRQFLLASALIQPSQPLMHRRIPRITIPLWRLLQIFPQELFRLFQFLLLQYQSDRPIKHTARIGGRHFLSELRDFRQPFRLPAPHRVIPNVKNQIHRLRLTLQRQRKLRIRRCQVFLL